MYTGVMLGEPQGTIFGPKLFTSVGFNYFGYGYMTILGFGTAWKNWEINEIKIPH